MRQQRKEKGTMRAGFAINKSVKILVILLFLVIAVFILQKYIFKRPLPPEFEIVIKTPQFEIRKTEDSFIPFQNNIPYSTFEKKEKHTYIDLGGIWKKERVHCDHQLTLLKRTEEVIKKIEDESEGRFQADYNHTGWKDKEIPGMENPPLDRYQDGAWYRRQFKIPKEYQREFIKLVFEGANYFTDVWVNGKWVGAHEGGYTPFAFDITNYINYGAINTLAVRVDNIPWLPHHRIYPEDEKVNEKNIVPYKTCDWWNSGGITRDIYLEIVPQINIVRADVRTKILQNKEAEVSMEVAIHNHSRRRKIVNLELEVFDTLINNSNILDMNSKAITDFNKSVPDTKRIVRVPLSAFEVRPLSFKIKLADIKLWHPDDPHLYSLGIKLSKKGKIIDEYYTQFGIREVKVDNERCQLLLNNKPLFLRGLSRHEVFPGTSGGEDFRGVEGMYRDLLMMKEVNSNFLRTAHYPNHPATYILADRVGMLIWEEIPVFWFDGPQFDLQRKERKIAKQMWLEMIYRDYNCPSIIFWSTCNECGAQKERSLYIKDLYETAYLIDGTRLVVQSASGTDTKDATHKECDLIGITSYYGIFYGEDYYDDTSEALDKLHAFLPHKPILVTEFGIWSEKDLSNAWNQVVVAQQTFDACREKPYVCGTIWWCAFDWHTMISEPQSMGLITWDRKKWKPVYFILQRLYGRYIGDLQITLLGPEYTKPLQGNVNFKYSIKRDKNLQAVETLLDGMPLELGLAELKEYTINLDTTELAEGAHTLIVKAKDTNNLTISNFYDFLVDNVDDFPKITLNVKDGNYIAHNTAIVATIDDDRGIENVLFKPEDKEEYESMKEMEFNSYVATYDISDYPDGSINEVEVKAIDTGGNETISKPKLCVDKQPAIAAKIPYNHDWISYEHDPMDADDFYNFPAEFLPESNSWFVHNGREKIKFKFGNKADGQNNNMECFGQLVKVPPDRYSKIYILGAMHNGNVVHYVTLEYKDGVSERMPLPMSDWWCGNANFKEEVAFRCSYHHEVGHKKKPRVGIYVETVECDEDKVLEAIRFPINAKVHIFAITLKK